MNKARLHKELHEIDMELCPTCENYAPFGVGYIASNGTWYCSSECVDRADIPACEHVNIETIDKSFYFAGSHTTQGRGGYQESFSTYCVDCGVEV